MSSRFEVVRWIAQNHRGMWCVIDHHTKKVVADQIKDKDWAHIVKESLEKHGTVQSIDEV